MENILEIKHERSTYKIGCSFALLPDMDYPTLLTSLTDREREVAQRFPSPVRAKEFAAGRYCAKKAFGLCYPSASWSSMHTGSGVWGHPYMEGSDVNLSIAHTCNYVLAVCAPGALPVGVDVEDSKPSNDALILTQLNDTEKRIVNTFPHHSKGLHLLWAAKEAAAKALRTGFRLPMPLFDIAAAVQKDGVWHVQFAEASVVSVIAAEIDGGTIALALPAGSTITKGAEEFFNMHTMDKK